MAARFFDISESEIDQCNYTKTISHLRRREYRRIVTEERDEVEVTIRRYSRPRATSLK